MKREVVQGIAIGLVAIVTTVSIGSYIAERVEAAHAGGHGEHGAAQEGGHGDQSGDHGGDKGEKSADGASDEGSH